MRILTVVYSLDKGGTERTAQNFATAYAELGHDSRVLFTMKDGIRKEYLESKSIKVYKLGSEETEYEIKRWKPEIVHVHSLSISIEEFKKIKETVPNSVIFETNVFSLPSPWAGDIKVSFQLSNWCNWLFKKRSHNKFRSAVIPNPVETYSFNYIGDERRKKFRRQYGIAEDDFLLGRVGQFYDGKWSVALIDVFEKLRIMNTKIKLLLVNPAKIILERIKKSDFRNEIIVIDSILGDDNLSICYSSIDLFAHIADHGESFGMVLTESLLCGTPVVSLSTPWGDNSQGEVIGNGIGGYVVNDMKVFYEKTLLLSQNKELCQKLGMNGRKRILDLFDSIKVAQQAINSALDINNNDQKSLNKPIAMIEDNEGHLNVITKAILRTEMCFWLLRYTMGYALLKNLPRHVLNHFYQKLVNHH